MGKKYFGEENPLTRSVWIQYDLHRIFKEEWYPYCKNTMRQALKIRFHWDRFEDKYDFGKFPNRRHRRCWKHYRNHQWK